MRLGWSASRLRELPIEIIDGDRSSKYPKQSEFQQIGVPFLNSSIIVDNRLLLDEANFISNEKFSQIKKGRVRRDDIVVTTRGNGIGKAAFFSGPSEALINAQMLILRADPSVIDPRFLFFQIISPHFQEKIRGHASGSAQPQIPIRDFRDIAVVVPPLAEQEHIAGILSAYDELIENNLRRIKILESMARALYREWFVRGNAARVEPEVEFTSGRLGDLCELTKVAFSDTLHAGRPLLDLARMPQDSLAPAELGNPCELTTSRILFEAGDTLFGAIRCYLHKVVVSHFPGVTNTSVLVLRPNDANLRSLLAIIASDPETIRWADTHSAGTKMPVINWGVFQNMPVANPSSALASRFEAKVGPMIDQIGVLASRIQNLRRARDLLLPRLLSGQVEVAAQSEELPA